MNKPNVLITRKVSEDILKFIAETCNVVYLPNIGKRLPTDLVLRPEAIHGILGVSSGLRIDNVLMDSMPSLKVVSNCSSGYNNFDLEEMTKRNILATNISGSSDLTETVADSMMGLLIASAKRFVEMDKLVKNGLWTKHPLPEQYYGGDVYKKTLGIIGMGSIGFAIAKRAYHGFHMRILYHNHSRNLEAEQEVNATYLSLTELLSQSDYVCLMTPLTSETRRLIGAKEFDMMKKTAVFVNGSRGETVDEEALIKALQSKKICAAGLDVYENEPIGNDHPLTKLSNVITLPHMSSATIETKKAMIHLATVNLLLGLKGERPPNLINEEVYNRESENL
jgi:glyoxylate/hydroxypyruvate/2-ketogluconate reductase